jgi:quinol monooxygenase YgiN
MKLFIFARFHAREGQEHALEALLRAQPDLVRAEPGCLEMGIYRSVRDPRLFWIHSRWADEAAFNAHANLPNTDRFIERAEQLIDHPLDVTRSQSLE